jgi:hypothetical protein
METLDAVALEKALLTETDPLLISSITFYLECGENEKALANYLKRAELGGRRRYSIASTRPGRSRNPEAPRPKR